MKNMRKEDKMSKEFKMVRLGDVGLVITGNTPKTSVAANYESEDISFYKPSDLSNDVDILNSSEYKVSMYAYDNSRKLPKGTVLVSCIGIIGKVGILNEDAICNQQINAIIPNENVSSNYIAYSILYNKLKLQSIANAPVVPIINKSAFSDIKIPLPSITKQQEIAAVLDKASELVEKRKAQLAELDVLAESIFYDMFGDPVTNEKGWKTEILKELTTKIGSGATPKGGNESYKDEGISLIRSLNVLNGVFKYKDLAHIDDEQAAALNNVTIECNDVLLNITGASVARCCIVPSEILPARVNQHVAIVRVIKERLHYRFLCSQLISVQYQRKLLNVGKSNGATREALTKTNVEDLKVILPPLQLQQQFAQRIEKIEEQKQRVKATLKESEDLFQRLMQDMFDPK